MRWVLRVGEKKKKPFWAVGNLMFIGCVSGCSQYSSYRFEAALRGTCCHPAAIEQSIFNQQKVNSHRFGMKRVVQMLLWEFHLEKVKMCYHTLAGLSILHIFFKVLCLLKNLFENFVFGNWRIAVFCK